MATAGKAKTTMVDGVRTDLNTGKPYTPIKPGVPVMTPANLTDPIKPAALPPPPGPTTAASDLVGTIGTQADAFTRSLEQRTTEARRNQENSLQSLITQMMQPGEVSATATEYGKEGGVDAIKPELDAINSEILAEQERLRKRVESIQTRAGTATAAERDREVSEANRSSLRLQADMAIKQLSIQGRYDSAKAIADRAVAAQLEGQKQKLDVLSLIYTENKDLFTTAEKREFETKQADRQMKLEMEASKEMARFEQMIKQNDPLYQAQLAKARQDVAFNASNPNGTINGKPQTATQAQVQGYAERTNQSDVIISTIGAKFTGASSLLGERLPNILKGTERQQYEQAQRNFVNAVLRRESGAVISDEEFANARAQYFPAPGDQPEVIAQKAQNRATVINNLYLQSNVPRAAIPGQIIEDGDGTQYRVGMDGETLEPL